MHSFSATGLQPAAGSVSPTRGSLWAGRILGWIVGLFLLADGVAHIARPAPVVEAFAQLGIPLRLSVGLGVLQLLCVLLYLVPRTAAFGAVLLTGYLGGAVAINLRAGTPIFPIVFPVLLGAALWVALILRDRRLRELASTGTPA